MGGRRGEGSLKRDRIPVQWSGAGCAQGQRSKLKYLLTPKARRRKKIHSPRERRCRHTRGLALLLVPVLLPLPCSGLGLAVWLLCTAGESSQTTLVGCRIAPFAAQLPLRGSPKASQPPISFFSVPVPCGAVWWQLAEPWREGTAPWGCHGGDPHSHRADPSGWAGHSPLS